MREIDNSDDHKRTVMDSLKVEHLCKTYGTGNSHVLSLKDVSFTVEKREVLLHLIGCTDRLTCVEAWICTILCIEVAFVWCNWNTCVWSLYCCLSPVSAQYNCEYPFDGMDAAGRGNHSKAVYTGRLPLIPMYIFFFLFWIRLKWWKMIHWCEKRRVFHIMKMKRMDWHLFHNSINFFLSWESPCELTSP